MFHGRRLIPVAAGASALWGCGGNDITQPPPPPVTSISAISPTSVMVGGPDLMLTITGTNFRGTIHNRSQAVWVANRHNTVLATTFASSTRLLAVVPAALLAQPGTSQVFVLTGDPAGDLPLTASDMVSFSVTGATDRGPCSTCPGIALSPASAPAGSTDLELTVRGSGFRSGAHVGSRIVWLGDTDFLWLATTFVSDRELTAVVPAAMLSRPGSVQVYVETGDIMGDLPLTRTKSATFTITAAKPAGTGAVLVHGRISTRGPRYMGYREVSLDESPWQVLREGESVIYDSLAPGSHRLGLSNPCTSTHQPSVEYVTAVERDTVTVEVDIPPLCE